MKAQHHFPNALVNFLKDLVQLNINQLLMIETAVIKFKLVVEVLVHFECSFEARLSLSQMKQQLHLDCVPIQSLMNLQIRLQVGPH